jgi:hypothetical protein
LKVYKIFLQMLPVVIGLSKIHLYLWRGYV